MLERAVTYKNNGQINIILNGQKQVLTNAEAEAEYQAALQKNEAKHSILKEIEKEMNTLVGMEEMKRNIKEIYAWIFVNQKRVRTRAESRKTSSSYDVQREPRHRENHRRETDRQAFLRNERAFQRTSDRSGTCRSGR